MTRPETQRCLYATDPLGRPDCRLTAVVRYGSAALCSDCDRRRSTLGKGQPPRPLPAGPPIDPLDWVTTAEPDLHVAADVLAAAVIRARQHGHPWSTIARALGVSRQAAQQRFGDPTRSRGRQPLP